MFGDLFSVFSNFCSYYESAITLYNMYKEELYMYDICHQFLLFQEIKNETEMTEILNGIDDKMRANLHHVPG